MSFSVPHRSMIKQKDQLDNAILHCRGQDSSQCDLSVGAL